VRERCEVNLFLLVQPRRIHPGTEYRVPSTEYLVLRIGSWVGGRYPVTPSSPHHLTFCLKIHLGVSAIGGGGVFSAGFGMACNGSGRSGCEGGIPGAAIGGP
jgi:hypothetical protein